MLAQIPNFREIEGPLCIEDGVDGGNVWLYHNWGGFIVWNLSQSWIGKTLLGQKQKIVSDQQTLSLCNWDTFLVWKILRFEIYLL